MFNRHAFIILACIFLLLSEADLGTTYIALSGGWIELNPIIDTVGLGIAAVTTPANKFAGI